MEEFNHISIEKISRGDFIMILRALDCAEETTRSEEYASLRNELIQQFEELSGLSINDLYASEEQA